MVNRNELECHACGTRIVTRTSIGHDDSQVHSFPCPCCGVGITYTILLDQINVKIDYDPNPENASWVDTDEGADHEVTFDAELLLPRYAITTPSVFPFIAASGFFGLQNIPTFQRQEAVRLHWRKEIWPITKRLPIHFQNENWTLFDSDAEKIGMKIKEPSLLGRVALLRNVYDKPFAWMLYPEAGRLARITQRIALAKSISPRLVKELADKYQQTGRMLELWRQLQEFHESFVTRFRHLSPLLQPKIYWLETEPKLSDYVVCDKRFPVLKPLYIDTFETLCRLTVIAMGFETIIHGSSLEILTKKGSMDLWSFEKLKNANKVNHITKYPISDLFTPYMDTGLRNGIGHNFAKYDAGTDEVVCIKHVHHALSEERLSYTVFCDRVFELASVLFHSEAYFFEMLEQVGGRLSCT